MIGILASRLVIPSTDKQHNDTFSLQFILSVYKPTRPKQKNIWFDNY